MASSYGFIFILFNVNSAILDSVCVSRGLLLWLNRGKVRAFGHQVHLKAWCVWCDVVADGVLDGFWERTSLRLEVISVGDVDVGPGVILVELERVALDGLVLSLVVK